ncbi:MAG TPA: outer membrane beta-barrel protein, partial [Bacteroidia bacterium]
MRSFLKTAALSLLISGTAFAQKNPMWFDIALTGSGGGSMLTSKNMFKDTKTVNSAPAFCYAFGGKFGININECHEIAFNAEYYSRNQKYGVSLDSSKFDKTLSFKGVDLALLYRFRGKESTGYMEIGPQLSLISGANEVRDGKDRDVADQFQKNYFSGVLGFGSNIIVANAFTWTAGFRFTTCFTDMVSDAGGRGNNISYPLNDKGSSKDFGSYTAFKATTFQLHTEFTFDLGYFVKA